MSDERKQPERPEEAPDKIGDPQPPKPGPLSPGPPPPPPPKRSTGDTPGE